MAAGKACLSGPPGEPGLSGEGGAGCTPGSLGADYELTSTVLGKGLCCDVRLAIDRETGERVAVKSFDLERMTDQQRGDLRREVGVQSLLDHGNVARLEGVYTSFEKLQMVIEHLPGGDVFEHLMQRGAFDEARAARVVDQLLCALEYLHGQNIVHRDIKPENLMYTSQARDLVKVIDFGLATTWQGESKMKRSCGTEGYRAPEVLQGAYTNKADLWSVGIVTHVLLTGDMVGRSSDGAPRWSRGFGRLSSQARDFVSALAGVDPELRPSASEALDHPWLVHHRFKSGVLFESQSTAAGTGCGTKSQPQSAGFFDSESTRVSEVSDSLGPGTSKAMSSECSLNDEVFSLTKCPTTKTSAARRARNSLTAVFFDVSRTTSAPRGIDGGESWWRRPSYLLPSFVKRRPSAPWSALRKNRNLHHNFDREVPVVPSAGGP